MGRPEPRPAVHEALRRGTRDGWLHMSAGGAHRPPAVRKCADLLRDRLAAVLRALARLPFLAVRRLRWWRGAWSKDSDRSYHERLYEAQDYDPFDPGYPGYVTIRRFADHAEALMPASEHGARSRLRARRDHLRAGPAASRADLPRPRSQRAGHPPRHRERRPPRAAQHPLRRRRRRGPAARRSLRAGHDVRRVPPSGAAARRSCAGSRRARRAAC